MNATPRSALPHGFATDEDALLAVLMLYVGAAIQALGAYYKAGAESYEGGTQEAKRVALDRSDIFDDAVGELRSMWAQNFARPGFQSVRDRLVELGRAECVGRPLIRIWRARVALDVLARLDGHMSRELPRSDDLDGVRPAVHRGARGTYQGDYPLVTVSPRYKHDEEGGDDREMVTVAYYTGPDAAPEPADIFIPSAALEVETLDVALRALWGVGMPTGASAVPPVAADTEN